MEALAGREIWGVRTGIEGDPTLSSETLSPLLGLWLGRLGRRGPGECGRIVGGPGEIERGGITPRDRMVEGANCGAGDLERGGKGDRPGDRSGGRRRSPLWFFGLEGLCTLGKELALESLDSVRDWMKAATLSSSGSLAPVCCCIVMRRRDISSSACWIPAVKGVVGEREEGWTTTEV